MIQPRTEKAAEKGLRNKQIESRCYISKNICELGKYLDVENGF